MQDFIYCQTDIPKEKWRYGFRSSAATGCGWIATYNALKLMGYEPSAEKLIRYYERQLPLIHGNTGTTILAPAIYFKQRGFVGYNTYRSSKTADFYGESLDGFLKKKKYFGAVLIGIKDKR